jgi:heme-degrading monooxygenase HmoA
MVLIVFRSRLREGAAADKEIEVTGARMHQLATRMPGFVSYAESAPSDGEGLTVVEFESHETLAAWRSHPEHIAAHERAREHWFSEYRITVADVVRDKKWSR